VNKMKEIFLKTITNLDAIIKAGSKINQKKLDIFFNLLVRKDETGEWICEAGVNWPKEKVDYDIFVENLFKKDKTGKWLYKIGLKVFNFNLSSEEILAKLLKKIIKIDKNGKNIEKMWVNYSFSKEGFMFVIDEICKRKDKINILLNVLYKIDNYKMEEVNQRIIYEIIKENKNNKVEDIYEILCEFLEKNIDINYEELINALIEKDETGKYIAYTITYCRLSDRLNDILFNALIEKDKTGEYLFYIGLNSSEAVIEPNLLFNELVKKDKTGEYILRIKDEWYFEYVDKIDYDVFKKALEKFNKTDE